MVAAVPLASCRAARSPIPVGVVFANTWTFDGSPLDASEIAVVKTRTLDTLNRASAGYLVAFDQAARPTHMIRIEDSSFAATPVQIARSPIQIQTSSSCASSARSMMNRKRADASLPISSLITRSVTI